MLNKIYEGLCVLLQPSFWCQLYEGHPYSKSFDEWCRKSLEEGCEFEYVDEYKVKFNGRYLWIANDKLCCFHLNENGKPKVSPSRYTKILMWNRYSQCREVWLSEELDSWK